VPASEKKVPKVKGATTAAEVVSAAASSSLVGDLGFHEAQPLRLEWLHERPDLRRHNYVLCTPTLGSCDKRTDCTFPKFVSQLVFGRA
jgi:hypothetical protein